MGAAEIFDCDGVMVGAFAIMGAATGTLTGVAKSSFSICAMTGCDRTGAATIGAVAFVACTTIGFTRTGALSATGAPDLTGFTAAPIASHPRRYVFMDYST